MHAPVASAVGSRSATRRPVLVLQADPYNTSRLATVLAASITSNTALAVMPGNVFLPAAATGLPRDSVVNVTALVTLNKTHLQEQVRHCPEAVLTIVRRGLRRGLVLLSPVLPSTPHISEHRAAGEPRHELGRLSC